MKSITKIYESGENEKSIGEAIIFSILDISVASLFGVTADILAAVIDITGAMADKVPDTNLKVNYIPKKGDDCMSICKCGKTEYVVSRNFQEDSKEEERCIKRIQSKRF